MAGTWEEGHDLSQSQVAKEGHGKGSGRQEMQTNTVVVLASVRAGLEARKLSKWHFSHLFVLEQKPSQLEPQTPEDEKRRRRMGMAFLEWPTSQKRAPTVQCERDFALWV